MAPTLTHEQAFWRAGYCRVAGVDEAGRGPLAGPVLAAAVVVTQRSPVLEIPGIDDSKTIRPALRERLADAIRRAAPHGLGVASAAEIDQLGIAPAGRLAMRRALWSVQCDAVLLDAFALPDVPLLQEAIIRGDSTCLCIAAASILAKVERDRLLVDLDRRYPGYGFAAHKGYGTSDHLAALRTYGPTPEHRRSFAPVRLL